MNGMEGTSKHLIGAIIEGLIDDIREAESIERCECAYVEHPPCSPCESPSAYEVEITRGRDFIRSMSEKTHADGVAAVKQLNDIAQDYPIETQDAQWLISKAEEGEGNE